MDNLTAPKTDAGQGKPVKASVLAELESMLTLGGQDISYLVGASNAELLYRIGPMRIFRRLDYSSGFFFNLFKLNLLFWGILMVALILQGVITPADAFDRSRIVLVGTTIFSLFCCFTALLVTIGYKPKRLKVRPEALIIGVQITDDVFSEFTLPWKAIARVEIKPVKRLGLDETQSVVICTALGVKYVVSIDDLLTDNSEASFVNAVQTWAPGALRTNLPRGADENNYSYTELWLHEFATARQREHQGLLPVGTELRSKYKIVGVLGGGGQGNAYLASVLAADNALCAANARDVASEGNVAIAPDEVSEPGEVSEPEEASERDKASEANVAIAPDVVLKEYILPVYRGSQVMERLTEKLNQEASILKSLDHPGIVRLYDCFVEDFRGYLVLEFVDGRSLKDLVVEQGAQSQAFVLDIAVQLASVLKYLHGQYPPVIHRDLSPDNIMLSQDGKVKVVDFNVARKLEAGSQATIVGKHAFIPPEQFRGKPTCQSDIYALGGTLYYLLTGEEPEPLSVSSPLETKPGLEISPDLDLVVRRATAPELADRFQDADELLESLLII